MGWSTAWAHVILEDVVTVSLRCSGHKSRDEAMHASKKENKERATRVRVQIQGIIEN